MRRLLLAGLALFLLAPAGPVLGAVEHVLPERRAASEVLGGRPVQIRMEYSGTDDPGPVFLRYELMPEGYPTGGIEGDTEEIWFQTQEAVAYCRMWNPDREGCATVYAPWWSDTGGEGLLVDEPLVLHVHGAGRLSLYSACSYLTCDDRYWRLNYVGHSVVVDVYREAPPWAPVAHLLFPYER